jgi:3-hydroxyacyl-CoA dehydrogenase
MLIPSVLPAIRMLESGFATADDIDRGWSWVLHTRKGPWLWPT